MRIAIVTATLPPDIGGMGEVAYEEAKGLGEVGHEVVVFTLAFPESKYDDKGLPFKVVRKHAFIMGGNAGFVPSFRNELKGFDLVHLHFPFYGGAEWVLASKVPYIVTYHMDAKPVLGYQKLVKFFYDKIFSLRILQKAKRVIVVDENHEFKWKKELFPEQVATIPNAIDTKTFVPGGRSESLLKQIGFEGKKVFIFVGNLLPVKGVSVLLQAFKKLPNEFCLLVVGGGYDEDKYKREADVMGLADRVRWLGPCTDKSRLCEYYNSSDAVVVPSFSESFSLVAGEALSAGRPVIASDIPGVRGRVIEDETGFLFKKGDPDSLRAAILKFDGLDGIEKRKMGEKARDLIVVKYNMEKHLSALLHVYQNSI